MQACELLAFIRFSKVGFTFYVISRVWWFVMVSVSENLSCLGVNLFCIEGHVCPCRECFYGSYMSNVLLVGCS